MNGVMYRGLKIIHYSLYTISFVFMEIKKEGASLLQLNRRLIPTEP